MIFIARPLVPSTDPMRARHRRPPESLKIPEGIVHFPFLLVPLSPSLRISDVHVPFNPKVDPLLCMSMEGFEGW